VLCLSETFSRLVFAKCLQSACLNFWHCRSFSVLVYAPKSLGCSNDVLISLFSEGYLLLPS